MLNIFRKKNNQPEVATSEYVTRKEWEENSFRHELATSQRLESVHTIVVDTRQQIAALRDQVKEYTSALLHHIECIDIAIRGLGDRIVNLEHTDKKLNTRITSIEESDKILKDRIDALEKKVIQKDRPTITF